MKFTLSINKAHASFFSIPAQAGSLRQQCAKAM